MAEQNIDFRGVTVLVVDDEESFHDTIEPYLSQYRVLKSYNGWQTLEILDSHHVDIVILDLNLPDTTGLKLLDTMRQDRDDFEVIVITAYDQIRHAVEAIKQGAFDFLAKTHENYKHLDEHIKRALLHRRRRREKLEAKTKEEWLQETFVSLEEGTSPEMLPIVKLARKVADTPLTVMLTGESGVGKEIMARYIHACSSRAEAPFVAINLAAVPAALLESTLFGHVKGAFTGAHRERVGKFETADGGTLFLDEIGELDGNAQVKLLRALQEREVERVGAPEPSPVDVRVIAATNKNLEKEVAEGRFREDLFYRLNVIRVDIPPLRRRIQELPRLLNVLSAKHATIMGREVPKFTQDAMTVLSNYEWPGNIRELENLVMRLVALAPGKAITADDIPPEYCLTTLCHMAEHTATLGQRDDREERLYFLAREQFERYLVRLMMNRHHNDRDATARALGVSKSTIKNKIRGDDTDWTLAIRRVMDRVGGPGKKGHNGSKPSSQSSSQPPRPTEPSDPRG